MNAFFSTLNLQKYFHANSPLHNIVFLFVSSQLNQYHISQIFVKLFFFIIVCHLTRVGAHEFNKCTRSLWLRVQTNRQVESCFLNHNSSIQFCCTDSLLMTHRGGISLSIINWRIGGGGQVSFCPGAPQFSWQPCVCVCVMSCLVYIVLSFLYLW